MRLALLAALAISIQLPSPAAEACGGEMTPAPRMFVVATTDRRTFALLDPSVPAYERLDWKHDPMSYDASTIAAAPAFPQARTLTVVGQKGMRIVTSKRHVFIRPVSWTEQAMNALEIPNLDGPMIAIEGEHKQAAFAGLEREELSYFIALWAAHPGFSPALDPQSLEVSKVLGTDLETITSTTDGHATTYFRTGDHTPWGGYAGRAIGAVTVDGQRYIVLVNDGLITPVRA